jgi:pyruvate dehydrogenase E1 component
MSKLDQLNMQVPDVDPAETREWRESFDAIIEQGGLERAYFILSTLLKQAEVEDVPLPALVQTPYVNTIAPENEPHYPGDEDIEKRIRRYVRWNAMAMVHRANNKYGGIGGHISTYASASTLYEVGYHHFFRGKNNGFGDMVFFQGHGAPGIYSRAFLEGRITEDHLKNFRREVGGKGLSSYPHPWLMENFWEFPTVSMGLGPMTAIYQARFNKYLHSRGICDTSDTRIWAFLGDGETDEPEALGALHVAAQEKLGNLNFVINCNLQRLDGPVRGNGKIIQELEAGFNGAGWRVIKVIWGREWDPLLESDPHGHLVQRMGEVVDGQYQKYAVEDGGYVREHFFGKNEHLRSLVDKMSDGALARLRRGGHDCRKVYAAYDAACQEDERPTVILAKTVKGWTLGAGAEGRNVAHNAKKLRLEEIKAFRDRLNLSVSDDDLHEPPYLRFSEDSVEYEYMMERRESLGGPLPERRDRKVTIQVPELDWYQRYMEGSGDKEVSTTGAFGQLLAQLMSDKDFGNRVVPIIPDEARTFGLDALFHRYGIWSSKGQLYEPVDAKQLMYYREAKDGQVLEEGISEAGATASFTAAGTSHTFFGEPMIPFYIFYSMFGFQRTADSLWAFADQRGRGFLLGATAGRTTLNGEGLQHQDGHSPILANTNPRCQVYDPAFAYEVAVIIQDGLKRMFTNREDIFYYLTLQNESYAMPPCPEGCVENLLKGLYFFRSSENSDGHKVQLLGSGSIMMEVLRAQELLAERGVSADVWSATSYARLRREALAVERVNMLNPAKKAQKPWVQQQLEGTEGPIIAASDYMKAVPDQIARWVSDRLFSLGTDGFGRSDTRTALRRFYEVDAECIVVATLSRLADAGTIKNAEVTKAIKEFGLKKDKADPTTI